MRLLEVDLLNGGAEGDLSIYGEVVARNDASVTLRVPKAETASVTGRLLRDFEVADLTVQDPPIEDVIEHVFNQPSA